MIDTGTIRTALVVVLAVGVLSAMGPGATLGEFADAHDGTASWTAANNFNNKGPTAEAGGPYFVSEGGSTELDGSGSEAKNKATYEWQILRGGGSLSSTTGEQVTYNAPNNVNGDTTVTVELNVTDSKGSDTDTAEVTIQDGGCGASSLTFCEVSFGDVSNSDDARYDVAYDVQDPSGGAKFKEVEVTLLRNGKVADSAKSKKETGTIGVSKKGLAGKQFTVRIELLDKKGNVVDCRETTDTADSSGPSSKSSC